jgi:hypothetical protein
MILANICKEVMHESVFGFFENMCPVKFKKGKYRGIFKIAHDNQPFVESFVYEDNKSFDLSEPILMNKKEKKGISLFPFYFWDEDTESGNFFKCYVYDKNSGSKYHYKSTSNDNSICLDEKHEGIIASMDCLHTGAKRLTIEKINWLFKARRATVQPLSGPRPSRVKKRPLTQKISPFVL